MKKEDVIDFLKGEFIGKEVEIINSANKDLVGLKGIIVDETKNMFEIETKKGDKKVQKKVCTFKFYPEKLIVEGKIIDYRPEDRISRNFKEW